MIVQSALVIAIPSLDKGFDSSHSTTSTVHPALIIVYNRHPGTLLSKEEDSLNTIASWLSKD